MSQSGSGSGADKGPPGVDMELKKAFGELQQKMIDSKQKVKFSEAQIEGLKRSVMHKQLIDKEMAALKPETKVYQGVGRSFFVSSITEVRDTINKQVKDINDKVKVFESNKDFLERDLKNSENSLRELVLQKKNAL